LAAAGTGFVNHILKLEIMKRKSERRFPSKQKDGKRQHDNSAVAEREHVNEEEDVRDNLFGNNDPANINDEFRNNAVNESEAGVGYVDSAYRRRKLHDWEDHNASIELNLPSSELEQKKDIRNDHQEEARGQRKNRNHTVEQRSRRDEEQEEREAGLVEGELKNEDPRGFSEDKKRNSRQGGTDYNRERGNNSRNHRRRK
jgi:hypothetical protein